MTDLPAQTQSTFIPQYDPPGLSIRAEFLATDGSRPQEVILEWRHDPGQEFTLLILDKIAEMAGGGGVNTVVDQPIDHSIPKDDLTLLG